MLQSPVSKQGCCRIEFQIARVAVCSEWGHFAICSGSCVVIITPRNQPITALDQVVKGSVVSIVIVTLVKTSACKQCALSIYKQ